MASLEALDPTFLRIANILTCRDAGMIASREKSVYKDEGMIHQGRYAVTVTFW